MYGAMVVLGSKAALGRLSDEQRAILATAAQDFGPEQRVFLRDAETMAMIRRAQPLPAFPPEVTQGSMSFTVPVRFAIH